MSEFSAWQDVLIELARIRGWLECWESTGPHQEERDAAIMRDRLARIEAIKPCETCGGGGRIDGLRCYGCRDESGIQYGGTGIAP